MRTVANARRALATSKVPTRDWARALGVDCKAVSRFRNGDSSLMFGPLAEHMCDLQDRIAHGLAHWKRVRTPGHPGFPRYEVAGRWTIPAHRHGRTWNPELGPVASRMKVDLTTGRLRLGPHARPDPPAEDPPSPASPKRLTRDPVYDRPEPEDALPEWVASALTGGMAQLQPEPAPEATGAPAAAPAPRPPAKPIRWTNASPAGLCGPRLRPQHFDWE